jgi:hypothetical protein
LEGLIGLTFWNVVVLVLEFAVVLVPIVSAFVSPKTPKEKPPVQQNTDVEEINAISVSQTGAGNIANVIQGSNNQIHYNNRNIDYSPSDNDQMFNIPSWILIAGSILMLMAALVLYSWARPLLILVSMLLCMFSMIVSSRCIPKATFKNTFSKTTILAVLFLTELVVWRPSYFLQLPQLDRLILGVVVACMAGAVNVGSFLSFALLVRFHSRKKQKKSSAAQLVKELHRGWDCADIFLLVFVCACVLGVVFCMRGSNVPVY